MRVILKQNVDSLGTLGDIVNVKPGYARNFLIPRGFASEANERNKVALQHQIKIIEQQRTKILNEARALGKKIEKTSVTIAKQVGEDEKIFGSVTTAELEEVLSNEGIKVSKKDIEIIDDIKKVGVYAAKVKLHPEVHAKFKVWVVAQ